MVSIRSSANLVLNMAIAVSTVWLGGVVSAAPPTRNALEQQAQRCRELLTTSLIDFYLPACLDREYGGYLETLDSQGRFAAGGNKFLVLQGRQLWFFSTLAENGIRKEGALAAARSGYEFLQNHFLDRDHGGYFNMVLASGAPVDRHKHCYMNAFALYGLCAYARASHDAAALKAAQDLFDVLDNKAYDQEHGGFQEYFTDDWRPVLDPNEPASIGPIGTKTYNTHLHLMETFTFLHRTSPDPRIERRLTELMQIASRTVQHPDYPSNLDAWTRDWKIAEAPKNRLASYGHDVECAWLVLDTARALGWSPDLYRQWAVSLVGYSLKNGYDEQHGGFYSGGPYGQPATELNKVWWVECEALVSMLEMYRLTGDERYYQVFGQTLDFIEQHQIAKAGGWWAERGPNGSPVKNLTRTSMWQGGYHNGRALLLCEQVLRELALNLK
jgi:mannobiose 2-epimerase